LAKLSIVIVNFNVRYFLEQCLNAVYRSVCNFEYEIFVVDNNSSDDSLQMLRDKFPQVKIIANKDNVGFSKANNQAINVSTTEYVLLLNPDTIIQEDTLQKCIAKVDEDTAIAGLGVKMVDGAGNFLPESKRGFPSPFAAFSKMSGLSKIFPKSKTFGQYHLTYLDNNTNHEVEVLSGAFMLLRKSVLDKIGLLDEDYFMYGEDIDLSYRIIKAGYKNYYLANTSIIHFKGESTKKGSLNYIKVFYNAMIIFANKHITGSRGKALAFILHIAIYLRAFFAVIEKIFLKTGAPLFDVSLMSGNLFVLHLVWENYVKHSEHVVFPKTFFYINTPIYVGTWLFAMWFFGVYNKKPKWRSLFISLITGTLLIAIQYAFFPNFLRTSRGVIVVGLFMNLFFLSMYRFLFHLINGTLHSFIKNEKKYIIIGNEDEANNISAQIENVHLKSTYLGFISIKNGVKNTKNLGLIENLKDILDAYKPNEILFSTEDLSMQFIIETMSKIAQPIEYKLVSKNNTMISSTSKNTAGEIYTLDIDISQKKSLLDKIRDWI
jgi:GT2 family glycosyltransferase